MSNILPDEILSEILAPALKISDEQFCNTSNVSPFADYSPSTSAYLLVCKDWLRVSTPLLYNVVILRSKSQANALENVLRGNPAFGRFIKKLRIEGGYGMAMHTIFESAPNITDLFLSLVIYASDSTEGLCKGLRLINPARVIAVDWIQDEKTLKNKQLVALLKVFFNCIQKWNNLSVFGFPYHHHSTERGNNLIDALSQTQVETILIYPNDHHLPLDFFSPFLKIPSLRALQIMEPLISASSLTSHPRLKTLIKHTVIDRVLETKNPSQVPDIAPSLNPSFRPMESVSDETREFIWKRVFFFAMYVEELRFSGAPRHPTTSRPSRLPILRVSKLFNRLGLPYLYDSLVVTNRTAPVLAERLEGRPDLGASIQHVLLVEHRSAKITDAAVLSILSYASNLQKISGGTGNARISADVFDLLTRVSGPSLRESSNYIRGGTISICAFARLTELRICRLGASSIKFTSESMSDIVMEKLHTLTLETATLFEPFSTIRLPSLHTLKTESTNDPLALVKLLNAHKDTVLHHSFGYDMFSSAMGIYDICKNLVDIQFSTPHNIANLTCETPHESLTTVVAPDLYGSPIYRDPEGVDTQMFPALRKIQLTSRRWPTTERDISKSELVKLAEVLLKKNIAVADVTGKCWIPRVKGSRKKR